MARETYRYTGNKAQGDGTSRRILEGSSTNPERFIDLGGEAELTESEVKALRDQGAELRKVSESASEKSGGSSLSKDDK